MAWQVGVKTVVLIFLRLYLIFLRCTGNTTSSPTPVQCSWCRIKFQSNAEAFLLIRLAGFACFPAKRTKGDEEVYTRDEEDHDITYIL